MAECSLVRLSTAVDDDDEFLRRFEHGPCGASASYMFGVRKTLRGIKNLLHLPVVFPSSPLLSPVPHNNAKFSRGQGKRQEENHRARPWPP
jgi:hypothetical protein